MSVTVMTFLVHKISSSALGGRWGRRWGLRRCVKFSHLGTGPHTVFSMQDLMCLKKDLMIH